MPELAEVEFYRKQWSAGLRRRVQRVHFHPGKRVTRDLPTSFSRALAGATLLGSEARAKQMLFRFSGGHWLGVHLGMTGRLHIAPPDFTPGRHDHLVLFQKDRALVFTDPRQFGRLRWHRGKIPDWWAKLPPAVISPGFTLELVRDFFRRRARLAVKAALLVQERFPGIGNWMADEILWRARIAPHRLCGRLTRTQSEAIWRESRAVCEGAMASVAVDFSDPPKDWFYHARWTANGRCPRCRSGLKTAQVGGRTTRWCPKCQR